MLYSKTNEGAAFECLYTVAGQDLNFMWVHFARPTGWPRKKPDFVK